MSYVEKDIQEIMADANEIVVGAFTVMFLGCAFVLAFTDYCNRLQTMSEEYAP